MLIDVGSNAIRLLIMNIIERKGEDPFLPKMRLFVHPFDWDRTLCLVKFHPKRKNE